ncbi:hypothetical protein NVV95_05290 [Herbiconiux sp. CPCC 205716]|uniref:DUF2238 domain-containing protein n=1 Tax=Herbiconiux gentiana TaxID=2970912 RepID=A0ABT2GCL5_9MICO|nr:hypothetical protein [Herbiconiux gentiana]MCS5713962.1 hypothetical protein [Herbiconiux gentiana]
MIQNFLRPPHGAAEWAADAVRVLALLSVVAAFVWWEPTDAGVLALVFPGVVLPRFVGVHPLFDIGYGVVLLVAAWSNVFDLYTRIWWWDIAVHLVATGVVAVLAFLLVARLGLVALSPGARVVLCAAFGLAASALWEMVEWLGKTFVSSSIFVTYDDTIGDMAVGGVGALGAGVVLAVLSARGSARRPARPSVETKHS